ncbi:MAG: copper ion binding protein [Nitrospiraceae bacterium]|nr:copper ion binding protein [Nitrospiraceae bacterium]MDA8325570.1 copper ion binding protein [Nitrospiraceae bacterium]
MTEATIRIEGMSCQHCVMAVKKAVEAVSGVASSQVEIGKAVVRYDEGRTRLSEIEQAIKDAGYKVAQEPE